MDFCCEECFPSQYLKNIIRSRGEEWNCDFCWSRWIHIIEVKNLSNIFNNLLSLYTISEKWNYIEKQLNIDFPQKIFSKKINWKTKEILKSILWEDFPWAEKLLNNKIYLKCFLFPEKYNKDIIFDSSWEEFIKEIRTINRFHIKSTLDLEKLEILFKDLKVTLNNWTLLYRARKSSLNWYNKDEMWKPPENRTPPWRANPKWIPYLYLASSIDTTLYEIRASLLDFISIWKFILNEDIEVLDFRNDIMVLADNENLEDFLIYKSFINQLDIELSKPYNSEDKELEYLPTQYISEFIKSLWYKWIIYNSWLSCEWYNLVVFNGNEFECLEVNVYSIEDTKFNYSILSE